MGPLTARQVEVLRWLGDGCPNGVWRDFTYKTTIYALAARELATVDRRRNSWSASLTDAGRFYLAHGRYPAEETPIRADPPGNVAPGIDGLAAEILSKLTSGAGPVIVESPSDRERARYRRAIHRIIAERLTPDGYLLRHTGRDRGDLTISLVPEGDARQSPPHPEVEVPAANVPLSQEVRDLAAGRRLAVTDNSMERALRILQAIHSQCTARGWSLQRDPNDDRGFRVSTPECDFELALIEELIDQELPDEDVLAAAKYPWQRVPLKKRTVGSGRLSLRLGPYYHCRTWADRRRWSLEDKLGAAVAEMQRRVDEADSRRRRREQDLKRRQHEWDAAVEAAKRAFVIDLNRRWIREQAALHAEAKSLRTYSQALRDLAEAQTGTAISDPLRQWAQAAQEEADRLDPLTEPAGLRHVEPENLQPDDYAAFMPPGLNAHSRPTR